MIHTVAVLRGGPSSEYDVSLKTGRSVLNALNKKYKVRDVTIDQYGDWFIDGIQVTPVQAFRGVDVVFNAMHGEYGEDGQVQRLLESLHMPFTGSKALSSALAMHKGRAKEIYTTHGIQTPKHVVVQKTEATADVAGQLMRELRLPLIVKPVAGGSSLGVVKAKNYDTLVRALDAVFSFRDVCIVEECIEGKEATVGVVEAFRDKPLYALLPIEIVPPAGQFFDYERKYNSGDTVKNCPGSFSKIENERMQQMAQAAHEALGLRHYSRSDFIIHPKRGVFILETNSQPGLTEQSLFPMALESIGTSYDDFLDHLLERAIATHK